MTNTLLALAGTTNAIVAMTLATVVLLVVLGMLVASLVQEHRHRSMVLHPFDLDEEDRGNAEPSEPVGSEASAFALDLAAEDDDAMFDDEVDAVMRDAQRAQAIENGATRTEKRGLLGLFGWKKVQK